MSSDKEELSKVVFLQSLLNGRKNQVYSKIQKFLFYGKTYESKRYGDKIIYGTPKGTDILRAGVEGDKPFMAGRFGTSECNTIVQYLRRQIWGVKGYGYHLDEMVQNAGFFPRKEEYLDRYCETILPLFSEIDLLCVMNCVAEDYVVNKYCINAELTKLPVVDPCKTGWTSVLKDKKVLVVHPMTETIEQQYKKNRHRIFGDTDILPEFELQTVKAVQTIAGATDKRFEDWFEALDYMTEEVEKSNFDVALVGCGAYGLPLAARTKKMGKKAVHMGGCLQLLFGIRGGRWDSRADMQTIMNDAWVRPAEHERPKQFKKIEEGCYW